MRGANHLPLYAGLAISGRAQGPQPLSHLGLGTAGAIHSPSSSSLHSSGFYTRDDSHQLRFCEDEREETHLSLGVRDGDRLILQPAIRLLGGLVGDGLGCVLVPLLRLDGLRVGDLGRLDPVLGLDVGRVVNLLLGVDRGREVVEE
jgi:hypothetical protein